MKKQQSNDALLRRTLLCAVLFSPPIAHPQSNPLQLKLSEPVQLTLESAIHLALRHTNEAINARVAREDQKYDLADAEDRYSPQWQISGAITDPLRPGTSARVGVGSSMKVKTGGSLGLTWSKSVLGNDNQTLDLAFSQPLFRGFGLELESHHIKRARIQEAINVRAFRDNTVAIIDSVISAWRQVQSAEKRATIGREALERAKDRRRIAKAMIQAGRQAPQDLVQFEAAVSNREYQAIDTDMEVRTAREELADILDLSDGVVIELMDEKRSAPSASHIVPDMETSLATAFENRTDWLRARSSVRTAEMDVKEAQNALRPNVSLASSIQYDIETDQSDWGISIRYSKMLDDDGPQRALTSAKNGLRAAIRDKEEIRRNIRMQVRQILHDISSAIRQIEVAGQGRELSLKKLQVERRKMDAGLSTAFQINQFENDLVRAQQRELDEAQAYDDAIAQLHSYLGTTLEQWKIDITYVGR